MEIKTGITGNLYALSDNKEEIEELVDTVGKSRRSIYWSHKFGGVWAIRVKDRQMKKRIKDVTNDDAGNDILTNQ